MLAAVFFLAACAEPNNTPVSSVTIENGSGVNSIKEQGVLLLTATVLPDNAADKTVIWSSSDDKVARVMGDGYVIGVAEGEVTITATAGGVSDSLKLYVVPMEAGYMISVDENGVLTYQIWDETGLNAWRDHVVKNTGTDDAPAYGNLDTNAILMKNITLTTPAEAESNWSPIGDGDNHYNGTFDGNGKMISNLTINSSDQIYIGLFGYIGKDAEVKNVVLTDVDIKGYKYVGGIAGYNVGSIENCGVSGTISSLSRVGGIAGGNEGEITYCYNNSDIVASGNDVGGIVGFIMSNSVGKIIACHNKGSVITEGNWVGGIVGGLMGNDVIACYNTGKVEGYSNIGGVVGYTNNGVTITACYSTGSISATQQGGGVVGSNKVEISSGYWSNATKGVGYGSDEGVQKVDDSTITWADATSDMNNAISNWIEDTQYPCNYKFEQTDDTTPPVLVEGAPVPSP